MVHRIFVGMLFIISCSIIVWIGINGWSYYSLPQSERVFIDEHKNMKPSGIFSHTLGVIGSSMIIFGVLSYSLRKRIKSLWNLGKISIWLDVHIFLCLSGCFLVIFHSTFKTHGIAGISLWTMLSVALSGIIGRFLYRLIPRNIKGNELNTSQILEELDKINDSLKENGMNSRVLQKIDEKFMRVESPKKFFQIFPAFSKLRKIRKDSYRMLINVINPSQTPDLNAKKMRNLIRKRTALIQKGIILSQVEKLFFYWHAVHFPFTIIMFITFLAHITTVVLVGYKWIF